MAIAFTLSMVILAVWDIKQGAEAAGVPYMNVESVKAFTHPAKVTK